MNREQYAETWRQYLYARTESIGRRVVDTEPGMGDDGRLTCRVFDAVTGETIREFAGTGAEITAAFNFAGHGEWITAAQIEDALAEMLAEIWPEEAA